MTNLPVLYSSNAIWAKSGYGVQGASLLPRLAELPTIGGRENVANFAWYGSQGGVHTIDGFRIYPAGIDPYGNDIIQSHTRDFQANIVITLIDAWVLESIQEKVAPALWLPWLPIDHYPVPERVYNAVKDAYLPLTYSKWGSNLLAEAGLKNYYIPHGIETEIYKILDQDLVANFKTNYLKVEGHLTVMVAANKGYPDRKAFQQQLRAWAEFSKDKPDARLYLHTEPTSIYGGINLPALCKSLGIEEKVLFPNRYEYFNGYPAEHLSLIYNAANVLMAASMAEGFGIPIIEAQACGTPVITVNFSAMPELIRFGEITEPLDLVWSPLESWQCWPNWKAIQMALGENYQDWVDNGYEKAEKGKEASSLIHQEFSWDAIVKEQWAPLMEKLHDQVFSEKPVQSTGFTLAKSGKVSPNA